MHVVSHNKLDSTITWSKFGIPDFARELELMRNGIKAGIFLQILLLLVVAQ